jgi:hypothetical protein
MVISINGENRLISAEESMAENGENEIKKKEKAKQKIKRMKREEERKK